VARPLHSLKSRYLFIAAAVSVFLIGGAAIANWYATNVSDSNSRALLQQEKVSQTIGDIRNAIWMADIALNSMLISPQTEHERDTLANLEHAESILAMLKNSPNIDISSLARQVHKLQANLAALHEKVRYLIGQRQDPNWVYPLLPYISQKLLEPNNTFDTAVSSALQEIAEDDGRPYASPLYGQFDELRDLWRRKILNFRAVIIRFAGLNMVEMTPQEQNIEKLHEEIEHRLGTLAVLAQQGGLGLATEAALEQMQEASTSWQENWRSAKALRSSSVWRNDINYMKTEIRPIQEKVFYTLWESETAVLAWSARNVSTVQQATNQIIAELWLLAGLALGFVVLVYILINRSVLRPIAGIAHAMSEEGGERSYRAHERSSREIYQLVTSFNVMRKQIHQRQIALEHQAMHDSLTGLPNRLLLHDRLAQAIHIMKRSGEPMALLLLDLDRFKEINDALGHQVGDHLLQQVAHRLQEQLRESDTVARLGGDEFAIVAPSTGIEQAKRFADKIVRSIKDVFEIGNQNLYVGVSVGVALYPDHGEDATTLIRHADIAMYVAKRNSLGHSVYEASQDRNSVDKLALVGDLHEELRGGTRLQLYYQPQIDMFTRNVVAIEALLRWTHPHLGPISPEHIINMAEHTGLIAALTQWVIDTALREYGDLRDSGNQLGIAINLSAWNLQDPTLPQTVGRALEKHGVPAPALTLEITESAMMNDPVCARSILLELSELGVNLSIDDFGTGFSSLGYLKMLPVNDLKIDKSFVIDMLEDDNDAIIVRSTIELAHNL
jgi:diguanylate cyclase (GGDEF)-like protein